MSEHTTHHRVALITGANKGIGRAAAEQLAALGMTVLIGARDPRRGEEAAASLRAVTLDVTDPATARATAKQVEERFGHLDVLINNAGITGSGQVAPSDAHDQVPSAVDLDVSGAELRALDELTAPPTPYPNWMIERFPDTPVEEAFREG